MVLSRGFKGSPPRVGATDMVFPQSSKTVAGCTRLLLEIGVGHPAVSHGKQSVLKLVSHFMRHNETRSDASRSVGSRSPHHRVWCSHWTMQTSTGHGRLQQCLLPRGRCVRVYESNVQLCFEHWRLSETPAKQSQAKAGAIAKFKATAIKQRWPSDPPLHSAESHC